MFPGEKLKSSRSARHRTNTQGISAFCINRKGERTVLRKLARKINQLNKKIYSRFSFVGSKRAFDFLLLCLFDIRGTTTTTTHYAASSVTFHSKTISHHGWVRGGHLRAFTFGGVLEIRRLVSLFPFSHFPLGLLQLNKRNTQQCNPPPLGSRPGAETEETDTQTLDSRFPRSGFSFCFYFHWFKRLS